MLAQGAVDFAAKRHVALTLVGPEAALRASAGRHRVVDAPNGISQQDSVRDALRMGPRSSMHQALALLAEGQVDAMVSAGNTGALMALSRRLVPMLPGIERPAIVKALEGCEGHRCRLLDVGANLECPPERLHQFALMGATLAEAVDETFKPRVGLLNVGAEHSKGPPQVRRAAELLEADASLRFVGFVEATELFDGRADVVVMDGFAGNVALKAIEGAAAMAERLLRRELGSGPVGWLFRKRLHRLAAAYNPQSYNGASFLGLSGVVVKSHGGADRNGFQQAIAQALLEVEGGVVQKMGARFGAQEGPA